MAQAERVEIRKEKDGSVLLVNGEKLMINGMNWDYFPIGTNYDYSLWDQSDTFIKKALDYEMTLLREMGVNVIRQYTGIPAKWMEYIFTEYGIYTLLNHSFGRYGLSIEGNWVANTDYSNPRIQEQLLMEIESLTRQYKDTPGLLMYMLGNENNYGLFWAGAETEDFPDDNEEKKYVGEKQGRPMYRLMNQAARRIKNIDANHPVAMCNGDVLFIDIIAEECTDIDVFGTNTYRGISFTDLFDTVKGKLEMPVMLTEFGADAFNALEGKEDQESQAYYLLGNWKEIYAHAQGLGLSGSSIGGFTFQFSDGWWKFGQTTNLDIHDTDASWSNGGYDRDFDDSKNNMNEEWFGICAKGKTVRNGSYALHPRVAYYALKRAHEFSPYGEGSTVQRLDEHFDGIRIEELTQLVKDESNKRSEKE